MFSSFGALNGAQPGAVRRTPATSSDASPLALPPGARVLFVLSALGAGGAERVATALCNYWRGHGLDVAIATFEAPGTPSYYPLDPGVRVHQLGAASARQSFGEAVLQTRARIDALSTLIRKERPSVVISFLTKINVITLLAAPGSVPVIVSERNNPNAQRFNGLWRAARDLAFPRAYALVAMTKGAVEAYPERQRPNATVIPNPVIIPAGLDRRSDGHTLVAVGRLTRQKRFDLLLDAFARIADDFPDWGLTIWGEGGDRAALAAQRDRLGLAGRVAMPGLSQTPGAWLETADAFVLCSDYEGWGNVLAESMAAGLPVLSTDCDFGPREMIEDGVSGLLVPTDDAAALTDGLSRLMSDAALRERLGAAAKARASAFFLPAVARQWETLAAAAIAARARARR